MSNSLATTMDNHFVIDTLNPEFTIPQELATILDTNTWNIHSVTNGIIIDSQSTVDKVDEWITGQKVDINDHPFLSPKHIIPFTVEDLVLAYLYKLKEYKEKQLEIYHEEANNLIPLVLQILHHNFTRP
ncbi:uncharacterized protein BX664DRAFT_312728 [Halteromyces radiatus]|uniref:uncharacterized protein n=1 Tax=Halteromyces radiatus TaxID=101107 RepID=UPI00222097F8|nr:uncharacterized protein BX664DRAFT_312728 [Halteromyces radiatus]KAI8092602.1 hypothetical protein BX664DRAFT_312728 [Halteromyces radiatus]